MEKTVVQHSGDEFVNELRQEKDAVSQKLSEKRSELSRLEADQRKLKSIIDNEKQQTAKVQHKKGKHDGHAKEIRLDIVRNDQKYKEQAKKIDELKRETQHLESDLKSLNHDLQVIEQGH
jgi:chromosome segregation ATPase